MYIVLQIHLLNCLLTQTSNQPSTLQQRSPDLNPMEHLWEVVETENLQQLGDAIIIMTGGYKYGEHKEQW